MVDHLIFDTTDFDTIDATHSVGAFVRSGKSGALITHHSRLNAGGASFNFVDGDVTPASDSISETGHGLFTGQKIQLTSSGTLPAGLALLTDYFVIRIDDNTIKLAASELDAERGIAVDITAAAGGGTHTLTVFESDVRALDVWMMNPSMQVTQGTNPWIIGDGGNSISIDDNGGSITVDGTVSISGNVTVDQGTSPWVIGDGGGSISIDDNGGSLTVDASNLDIRDLDYTRDNLVIAGATGNMMVVNADGSINVNADISVVNGHEKAEDAAHSSGDIGSYVLAVRQDVLANSVSADGDYASLKVDANGALYTNISNTISINDAALANTAIAAAANPLNVADTPEDVVASPLANRKYLWIYNNDNTRVFVGQSGVSAANGFPVSPGSYLELRAGAAIDIEFVGQAGKTPEIRTLELS